MSQQKILEKVRKSLNIIFVLFVVLIYLIISPILFYQEYHNNNDFKELMSCEVNKYNNFSDDCTIQNKLDKTIKKSNFMIYIIIFYWFGVIFIEDIWPYRKKIMKYLENLEN